MACELTFIGITFIQNGIDIQEKTLLVQKEKALEKKQSHDWGRHVCRGVCIVASCGLLQASGKRVIEKAQRACAFDICEDMPVHQVLSCC